MANSFFKNGDKVYSENLNDSILVGNAFDWTVTVSLPTDTGAVFPNSSTVVKGKVADLSITPNSNLSIGSTVSNSSGSNQVYRLTVYPAFNRFGGFKSISLTGDGTFYIANKGGTSPIVNNLDYTDLSNVPELKVLKEYDIVVTIPNNGEVTGLSFVFQSSSADVSGIISRSNVSGLNDEISRIDLKDSQQDTRLTAIESVGASYYKYKIWCSSYNISIDDDVTVYVKVYDQHNQVVSGKVITLMKDNTQVSSKQTNSDGEANWTVTCDTWGLITFSVEEESTQVNVTGWKNVAMAGYNGKIYNIKSDGNLCCFEANISLTTVSTGSTTLFSFTNASDYLPYASIQGGNAGSGILHPFITNGGDVGIVNGSTGSMTSVTARYNFTWRKK